MADDPLEERVRVLEEQYGGEEAGDVHHGMPREHEEGPDPRRELQAPRGRRRARALVDGAPACRERRHGRKPRRVCRAAGARHEEREQRHAVPQGVVHADGRGGRGLGGREVEEVELPQRPRPVHGGRGERRHVVLHGHVRVGRHGGRVETRVDEVVVHVHRRLCPTEDAVLARHLHVTTCKCVAPAPVTLCKTIVLRARTLQVQSEYTLQQLGNSSTILGCCGSVGSVRAGPRCRRAGRGGSRAWRRRSGR